MRTLRVGNIRYLDGVPYRTLKDLDFVRYEENTSVENARKLNEGELDIALISAADFALHGGYLSLDFGLGNLEKSDAIVFYSECPVEEVESVSVFDAATSSALLLRLVLKKIWNISPPFIRQPQDRLMASVTGRNAALVFHEVPAPEWERFPIAFDIVQSWIKLRGLPHVSLLWAVRPNILTVEQQQFFHDLFHRSVKARHSMAREHAIAAGLDADLTVKYVGDTRSYYINGSLLEGLEDYISVAAEENLLPHAPYRRATVPLLKKRRSPGKSRESIEAILFKAAEGKRIAVDEGLRLATEAPLPDLGMAANVRRLRTSPVRSVDYVFELPSLTLNRTRPVLESEIDDALVKSGALGATSIVIPPGTMMRGNLETWEFVIGRLMSSGKRIEAGAASDIRALALAENISLEDVVSRLSRAGLKYLPGEGGEMLSYNTDRTDDGSEPAVMAWLEIMKIFHKFRIGTSAFMRISREDTWESRLLHLSQLRVFQDEIPGIEVLALVPAQTIDAASVDEWIRATAISRLFLDNVKSVEERHFTSPQASGAALAVGAGADRIRLVLNKSDPAVSRVLWTMKEMGLDIELGLSGMQPQSSMGRERL